VRGTGGDACADSDRQWDPESNRWASVNNCCWRGGQSWEALPDTCVPRVEGAAALGLADGRLALFGGRGADVAAGHGDDDDDDDGSGDEGDRRRQGRRGGGSVVLLASAEALSADGSEWLPLPPMPQPLSGATAGLLPDGRVLLAGGYVANPDSEGEPPRHWGGACEPACVCQAQALHSTTQTATRAVVVQTTVLYLLWLSLAACLTC
jgi:hypothetical protein